MYLQKSKNHPSPNDPKNQSANFGITLYLDINLASFIKIEALVQELDKQTDHLQKSDLTFFGQPEWPRDVM